MWISVRKPPETSHMHASGKRIQSSEGSGKTRNDGNGNGNGMEMEIHSSLSLVVP